MARRHRRKMRKILRRTSPPGYSRGSSFPWLYVVIGGLAYYFLARKPAAKAVAPNFTPTPTETIGF